MFGRLGVLKTFLTYIFTGLLGHGPVVRSSCGFDSPARTEMLSSHFGASLYLLGLWMLLPRERLQNRALFNLERHEPLSTVMLSAWWDGLWEKADPDVQITCVSGIFYSWVGGSSVEAGMWPRRHWLKCCVLRAVCEVCASRPALTFTNSVLFIVWSGTKGVQATQQEVDQPCLLLTLLNCLGKSEPQGPPCPPLAPDPRSGNPPLARFLFSSEVPFLLAEALAACHPFLVCRLLFTLGCRFSFSNQIFLSVWHLAEWGCHNVLLLSLA